MIRIAATADVHCTEGGRGTLRSWWKDLDAVADVLLVGGDLTAWGSPREAAVVAEELATVSVPVITVLGNHDVDSDESPQVRKELESRGIVVLEGDSLTLTIRGETVGIVGVKGFGGGFRGACGTAFGEPEMKAFVRATEHIASHLAQKLSALDSDYRIALLHYSPIEATLAGERLEIYPFLGSYLLGEAIDSVGADLVIHGHAHRGVEVGRTPGGFPVRNVAVPVLRRPYTTYCLEDTQAPPAELSRCVPEPPPLPRPGPGGHAPPGRAGGH